MLAATNALSWEFPGSAVSLHHSEFKQSAFQASLSSFLEKASVESVKQFAARTQKAGFTAVEIRNTVDPAFVTDMLMTLLEAYGQLSQPSIIHKRIRDDVCWTIGAERPWRRTPFWLVLRVGLSRYLQTRLGQKEGRFHYKTLLCILMKSLVDDAAKKVDAETLRLLNAKLARRLTKLEEDLQTFQPSLRQRCEDLFRPLDHLFLRCLNTSNDSLATQWSEIRAGLQKFIPRLPLRADEGHLVLDLPHSRAYLENVLLWRPPPRAVTSSILMSRPPKFEAFRATAAQFRSFAMRYAELADFELLIERRCRDFLVPTTGAEQLCTQLAHHIFQYVAKVGDAYDENAEQKSLMILNVIDLWMRMDQCAVEAFPLLKQYTPSISAEILDVVLLSRYDDLNRLRRIQCHLLQRASECQYGRRNIFGDPIAGCFPEQYFDSLPEQHAMRVLLEQITNKAEKNKEEKRHEWEAKTAEYRQIQQKVANTNCEYIVIEDKTVHKRGCLRCRLDHQANSLRIQVHEYPLPEEPAEAKAVLFELAGPNALKAYRDVTWQVCYPHRPTAWW